MRACYDRCNTKFVAISNVSTAAKAVFDFGESERSTTSRRGKYKAATGSVCRDKRRAKMPKLDSVGDVLKTKLVSSKTEILNTQKLLTNTEVRQRVLILADGLTADHMTAWYCKAFRTLGESRFSAVCSTARDPQVRDSKRLFGWLLKQELEACKQRAHGVS